MVSTGLMTVGGLSALGAGATVTAAELALFPPQPTHCAWIWSPAMSSGLTGTFTHEPRANTCPIGAARSFDQTYTQAPACTFVTLTAPPHSLSGDVTIGL